MCVDRLRAGLVECLLMTARKFTLIEIEWPGFPPAAERPCAAFPEFQARLDAAGERPEG